MKHQPIGSCVVVFNHDRTKILLGKRQNSYKAGYYGIPGGRIEPNEQAIETAKRELLEETGLTAKELRYLGIVKEWQGEWFFIHFGFVCERFEGELQNREDKCESWEWFAVNDLPQMILPGHLAIIEMARDKRNFVEI